MGGRVGEESGRERERERERERVRERELRQKREQLMREKKMRPLLTGDDEKDDDVRTDHQP